MEQRTDESTLGQILLRVELLERSVSTIERPLTDLLQQQAEALRSQREAVEGRRAFVLDVLRSPAVTSAAVAAIGAASALTSEYLGITHFTGFVP